MKQFTSALRVLVSGLIGFIAFIFITAIANVLKGFIQIPFFHDLVNFLNSNLLLITVIAVLFILGEMFAVLFFPFNLPYPLFNAFAGVAFVAFIINLIKFADKYVGSNIGSVLDSFSTIFYLVVFIIALSTGILSILSIDRKKKRKSKN